MTIKIAANAKTQQAIATIVSYYAEGYADKALTIANLKRLGLNEKQISALLTLA